METTRAAELVTNNIDTNKPFSLENSVCNNPPNMYYKYTLDAFVKTIDDKTKDLLFSNPIRMVSKKHLETNNPVTTPGQVQSTLIISDETRADGSVVSTIVSSPPHIHRIESRYKSILQDLYTQWNDDQKSIWKIYDETRKVSQQNVQAMLDIGNLLMQLGNMHFQYPGLDVSESPFRNNTIANNNLAITVTDMFTKPEVFNVLYARLKELTSIQEEKKRNTGPFRNRNSNSVSSDTNNEFTRMKILLAELKRKYQDSRPEWNLLQEKEKEKTVHLMDNGVKETIKSTLGTAQEVAKILSNNPPFQSEDTPFNGCSKIYLEEVIIKTRDNLLNDSVYRDRIAFFCDRTHNAPNVLGPSTSIPRRSGDPARNIYEMFCGNDFLLGEQLAQVFPKIDKIAKMTTPEPFEREDICQLEKNEKAKDAFKDAGVQFGLIAVWNINQNATTPGNTTQPLEPPVFADKKDYGAFLYTPYTKNPASQKLISDKLQHISAALKLRDHNHTYQKTDNNVVVTSEPESALTFFTNKRKLTLRAYQTIKSNTQQNPPTNT
jgi:hypothetical protein